jgi:tetratricopeptide (TPR) repeat protein
MVAHVGWHYVYCGNYLEAMPYSRAALDMDPTFFAARTHLGLALEQLGRLEEAIEEFSKAGEISAESSEAAGGLGHAFAAAGRTAQARRILEEMDERAATRFVSPFDRALVHAGLADREAALKWLEGAAEERVPEILELKTDPRLANLAGEPRLTALARRIGLPE